MKKKTGLKNLFSPTKVLQSKTSPQDILNGAANSVVIILICTVISVVVAYVTFMSQNITKVRDKIAFVVVTLGMMYLGTNITFAHWEATKGNEKAQALLIILALLSFGSLVACAVTILNPNMA